MAVLIFYHNLHNCANQIFKTSDPRNREVSPEKGRDGVSRSTVAPFSISQSEGKERGAILHERGKQPAESRKSPTTKH